MVRAAVLLALVAILCLAGQASAAYMNGVTDLINATALARYINSTLDACDIASFSGSSEYLLAQSVYDLGKNSRNNAGVLRVMKTFANRPFTGEAWYDNGVAHFGFPNFIDFLLGRAVTGQWPYDVSRGARQRSTWMYGIGYNIFYSFHEVDAARARTTASPPNWVAAAAEAEDALAVFWGGELGNYCNAPHMFHDVSKWSCTMTGRTTGSSLILNRLVASFAALKDAAKANSATGFEAARLRIFNHITAGLLQWVHRGARGAQVAKDIDTYRAQIAIARAAFNIAVPHIKAVAPASIPAFVAATEFDTRHMDKQVLAKVRAALTAVAPSIGYTYKTLYAC